MPRLRLPPVEKGVPKVTFCSRGAACRARSLPLFTTVMGNFIRERFMNFNLGERRAELEEAL